MPARASVRNVQIGITGMSLNALTDAEGRYRVANVPDDRA
jgi:hypothetical protein